MTVPENFFSSTNNQSLIPNCPEISKAFLILNWPFAFSEIDISGQLGVSDWLLVDEKKFSGTVKSIPDREDILPDINENLVVEFYSK